MDTKKIRMATQDVDPGLLEFGLAEIGVEWSPCLITFARYNVRTLCNINESPRVKCLAWPLFLQALREFELLLRVSQSSTINRHNFKLDIVLNITTRVPS